MQFTPKTEEEIQRSRLLPKGPYPFTVAESTEKASQSEKNPGKMMAVLKLILHADHGDFFQTDRFADWFMAHKLRHFAETVGKLADYEKGSLVFTDNRFQGATGYLWLGEETDKRSGDLKNTVKDYLTKADYDAAIEKVGGRAATVATTEEDPMPF